MTVFHAFIDRKTGGMAALEELDGEARFDFPSTLLPDGVTEGDVVAFEVEEDPERRDEHRSDVQDLQDQLIETPDD